MNKVAGIIELQSIIYEICAEGYHWNTFMSKNINPKTSYPFVEIIESQFIPGRQKGVNVGTFLVTIHIWNDGEAIENHANMAMKLYESLRLVEETEHYQWAFDDSSVAVTFMDDTSTGSVLKHAVVVAPFNLLGLRDNI